MPIPLLQTEEQAAARRAEMHLVESQAAPAGRSNMLYPRAMAHFFDVSVLHGFSVYMAKFFSVMVVALHSKAIAGTGKVAGALFLEAYNYSTTQLYAAALASLSIFFFVVVPMLMGRTLAMGLFGLKIRSESGEEASPRQLLLRVLGCAITYASLGTFCLYGVRNRDGHFFHDVLSKSKVTRD